MTPRELALAAWPRLGLPPKVRRAVSHPDGQPLTDLSYFGAVARKVGLAEEHVLILETMVEIGRLRTEYQALDPNLPPDVWLWMAFKDVRGITADRPELAVFMQQFHAAEAAFARCEEDG